MLRGAIGSGTGPRLQPRDAGHVDNESPALFLHLFERGPAAQKGSPEIHVHDRVERLDRRFSQPAPAEYSRIVDDNVDATVLLNRSFEQLIYLLGLTHIRLNDKCVAGIPAYLCRGLLTERLSSGRDDNLGTLLAELKRNGLADSTATAGDNGHLVQQSFHAGRTLDIASGSLSKHAIFFDKNPIHD